MIRVGIFGTHGHTEKFIRMLKESGCAEAAVLWNDHEEQGLRMAAALQLPYEPDYQKAIDAYGIDAAVVTVPAYMHHDIVIALAAENRHIFLEKPLCVSLKEAEEMRAAVLSSTGKFFMSDPFVGSEVIEMRRLIREGRLGEITGADVRICGSKNWNTFDIREQQGGIIASIGGHGMHVLQYLFGSPKSCCAVLQDASGHGTEDNCSVIFQYSEAMNAVLQTSWVSGGNTSRIAVYGTEGFATAEASPDDPNPGRLCWTDRTKGIMSAELPPAPKDHISYFLKMIAEDLPNDIIGKADDSNHGVSIENAYEIVKMINMIHEEKR